MDVLVRRNVYGAWSAHSWLWWRLVLHVEHAGVATLRQLAIIMCESTPRSVSVPSRALSICTVTKSARVTTSGGSRSRCCISVAFRLRCTRHVGGIDVARAASGSAASDACTETMHATSSIVAIECTCQSDGATEYSRLGLESPAMANNTRGKRPAGRSGGGQEAAPICGASCAAVYCCRYVGRRCCKVQLWFVRP